MKKIVALSLFITLFLTSVYADWNFGLDLRGIDCLWSDSMRFDIEAGYKLEDVRISLMCAYSASKKDEVNMIDGGVALSFYPFENHGFYVGCTLFKLGYLFGLGTPNNPYLLLSEANLGWSLRFSCFYVEPRFSFSDSLSSEDSTLSSLRESISQYSPFRLSLLVGVWI